jgi:hypothetical protein
VASLKSGADLGVGVDHSHYQAVVPAVAAETRAALVADLA